MLEKSSVDLTSFVSRTTLVSCHLVIRVPRPCVVVSITGVMMMMMMMGVVPDEDEVPFPAEITSSLNLTLTLWSPRFSIVSL